MRNVCKVLSWLSNSLAAALLVLAVLATPSVTLAGDPPCPGGPGNCPIGGGRNFCFYNCTDTCPARTAACLGCLQDSSYCVGGLCLCTCDAVVGSLNCECNN